MLLEPIEWLSILLEASFKFDYSELLSRLTGALCESPPKESFNAMDCSLTCDELTLIESLMLLDCSTSILMSSILDISASLLEFKWESFSIFLFCFLILAAIRLPLSGIGGFPILRRVRTVFSLLYLLYYSDAIEDTTHFPVS